MPSDTLPVAVLSGVRGRDAVARAVLDARFLTGARFVAAVAIVVVLFGRHGRTPSPTAMPSAMPRSMMRSQSYFMTAP